MLFMQKKFCRYFRQLLLVYIQIIASSGFQDTTQQHKHTNISCKYHAVKNNLITVAILKNVDNSKNIFAAHRTTRLKSG